MSIKYQYVMCGMFDGTDGYTYSISMPLFWNRDSEDDAMADGNHAFRFVWYDKYDAPVIACFDRETHTTNVDSDGNKCLKVCVEGRVLGVYSYDEFIEAGGIVRRLKESSKDKFVIDDLIDFEDTALTFKDMFPNMSETKLYYVDNEAYSINTLDAEDFVEDAENL